ncbi:MAG: CGGC domain-containing protein [Crenarchaeota archaeon]|nr:CGGC domain-containing protein [Thermoproteota archaeon]NPA99929.1 CGGC domain-containing protein [Thermoproteota archaeon]
MSKPDVVKVVIIACKKIREQGLCPGDAKCLIASMRKEGKFAQFGDKEVRVIAIVDCGECPGTRVGAVLTWLKPVLDKLGEKPDAVMVGTCIMRMCKYKDEILERLKKICQVPVIEGTHEYAAPFP